MTTSVLGDTTGPVGRTTRWKILLLVGIWSLPAVVLLILAYGVGPAYGFAPPRDFLDELLFVQVPLWGGWAAATPLIFRLSARHHPGADGVARPVLLHAGAAVLLLLVHTLLLSFVQWRAGLLGDGIGPWHAWLKLLPQFAVLEFVLYPAVAATGFALHMMGVSRRSERRASRLETQLSEARLEALRMKLHPHFLFNALNTVVMQMRRGAHREALELLLGFAELLREILDLRRGMIPLEEEIDLARRYLAIEHARFGDRLSVELEEDPAAADALVPTLLLQPLVENALRHGVARLDRNVTLRLTTDRRGERLRIRLRNDGPPLPDDWSPRSHEGTGIRLTRLRVREAYEAAADVDIRSADGGVEVLLDLPFRVASEAVALSVAL